MTWLWLDGQVGRLGAFEDLINIARALAVKLDLLRLKGHQPAVLGVFQVREDEPALRVQTGQHSIP